SCPALTVMVTGSLLTSAPLSTVTLVRPANVAVCTDLTAAPVVRTATVRWAKVMSRSPKVLASRTRTDVPPEGRWTIRRKVWLVYVGGVVLARAEDCGDAAQESTHVGRVAAALAPTPVAMTAPASRPAPTLSSRRTIELRGARRTIGDSGSGILRYVDQHDPIPGRLRQRARG